MAKTAYTDVKFKKTDENYGWTKLFGFFTSNSHVLDIGCSSGNFGKELIRQKKCTVVGVDINQDDLKIARSNLTEAAWKNIEMDDFSDLGTFDYVLMADVIEHLVDPVSALKKAKQLLKPGGKLVFSVPNMANIANRIELLGGRFEYTKFGLLDETHIHYYDRVELEKVMARAGFEIRKYNNTIRDVHPDIIKARLNKIGLATEGKFMEMAKEIDSITFHFIGIAEPADKNVTHSKVESKIPHDFLSQQFDEMHQAYDSLRSEMETRLKIQNREKKELAKEVRRLDDELRTVHSSKSWRYISILRGAKSKITRVFYRK